MTVMLPVPAGYAGKRVLIAGGLGFIGSSLAHRLVALGADVWIVDSLDSRYGGNTANLEGIQDRVKLTLGDAGDDATLAPLLEGVAVVFNLAAQVSYIDSNRMPFTDLDLNCRAQLTLLEAVRRMTPQARVVFASSRLVLGTICRTPVTEEHPTNPRSLYAIHKLTAEKYHQMYADVHGLHTAIVRLANPYGARQQIKHDKYSLPGWFMRLAMEGKPITVFGDGAQLRDYVYIADVVDAFLRVGLLDGSSGEVFNCGSGTATRFADMAEAVVGAVGRGKINYVPWPADYERVETGDVLLDIDKLRRRTGWSPTVSLGEGIADMVRYYADRFHRYAT